MSSSRAPGHTPVSGSPDSEHMVDELVGRARAAQAQFERYTQAQVDEVVTAAAWAIVNPPHARALAEIAVRDSGLGNVADKIAKNHRKTIGLLRDLKAVRSVGVIASYPETGIVEIARLQSSAPRSLANAIEITLQICAGLREAHAQGVIHRDLKPENIMITRSNAVKIMDFGIARSVESPATTTGAFLGTPAYMAPEQAHGKPVDQRADIYALGLILYELLTGRRAFSGDTPIAVALKQVNERPVAPRRIVANIPVHVEAVILRCLEKDPARRFATVDQVENALKESTAAVARVPVKEQSPPPRRASALAWFGMLVAAVGLVVVWQNTKRPTAPPVASERHVEIAQPLPPTTPQPPVETARPPERIDGTQSPAVAHDRGAAFDKLVAAAEAGRPEAQYRLAQILAVGPPARRDESKAVEWMRRAAEQGYSDAQFGLGKMYENGHGVERNPAIARTWYERAAGGGHEEARNLLRRFSERSRPRR